MKKSKFSAIIRGLAGLGVAITLLLPENNVYAAAILVTSNTDVVAVNGLCTLREAIVNANNDTATNVDCAAGTGVDTITFSGAMTITLTSSLPNITDTDLLTINGGSNVVVSGNNLFRIVTVDTAANVTFQNITLQDGAVDGNGGAILNNGNLTVTNSLFTNNSTITTVGNDGGAISQAAGTLIVTNTTFSNNFTQDNGGAIYVNTGTADITGSTFLNNNNSATDDGGALYLVASTVIVTNSTFTGNRASLTGGAIRVSGGTLTVIGSTFTDNGATGGDGGAIYHSADTLLTITNSTFTANRVDFAFLDSDGGAIYMASTVAGASLNISGSTFTGNLVNDDGGALFFESEPATITNTTFSNNQSFGLNGTSDGGAIATSNMADATTILLSTFTNNSINTVSNSSVRGGAISNLGDAFILANDTFSGNSVTKTAAGTGNAEGGAVFTNDNSTINNVTFNSNSASETGTGIANGGSLHRNASLVTVVTVANSILSNSTENAVAGNCGGTITDGGNNIQFNSADCGATFTNIDPNLAAITGSPAYYPLNLASPAIDAGSNAICATATTTNNQSQNGQTRPQGVNCDIGSYEIPALVIPTLSITNSPAAYSGLPLVATVTCSSSGAVSNILYDGSSTAPTNVGTYVVTANCAAVSGFTSLTNAPAGNFVINPIAPTATVSNTPQSYTGAAQSATVSCSGGGVASNILTGGAASQINTGSYAVTADCAASTNYTAATGLSAGNFVINSIGQTITVTTNAPGTASNGSTFSVVATASSGLPVTISVSGVCSGGDTDGDATITMTSGSGTCVVSYDQAGNTNYSAASQVQESVNATVGPAFTSANNASFDLSLPGSFTITAVGNPSTMTILLAGTLPTGVTLTDNGDGTALLAGVPAIGTDGIYNLTFTANNGVLPNATQSFTLTVRNGPIVIPNGVNSFPDTGNGSISENESIMDTLGITKLIVQFNQDVNDPLGNSDVKDVTNPANYILVRSATVSFATIDCNGGVVAPDISISVDSVTYSNGTPSGTGPFISTLSINSGLPLNVVGFYRLYVCGTTSIVDAINTNLILAGNGTTPGTDFQRNFRIITVATGGGSGATTSITNNFVLPLTGFDPNQVTTLSVQPADKAYETLGQMTIEIPTLGINFPIVGASIAGKTWDLTWLQNSVAYLEGSAYPTLPGNTVLTGHVRDASNNLGPFSDIKWMKAGQKVFIHANGLIYVYQVQENQKISPNSISTVFKHEVDDWITLVTCEDYNTNTGLYTSRRMVRAVLISIVPEK